MLERGDYRYIEAHVPSQSRVLDLGCGDGSLIERLSEDKDVDACGIDIDEAAVRSCIRRGVSVYHGDMLEGMGMFANGSFDCVVLSQTLQQTLKPVRIVEEMLRVGRRAIISFPNFGQWSIRLQLLLKGRAPKTKVLRYNWYNTPNLRVLTVKDFREFCTARHYRIIDAAFFTATYQRIPKLVANFLAASATFVIEKGIKLEL
ncbi:MAG: methionine biosynthesis protein MetW [Planctomycetes bacterium]|nr:methionine biosynthesis protein MetW [Planctomycetota bacterium]